MTLSDRAAAAAPYARQLLDNTDVQASARQAAQAAQAAYTRARGKDTVEIVKDKKFRGQVSQATSALGRLWGASTEPPPKPKRRWPRLVLVIVILAGAAAALTNDDVKARVQKLVGQDGSHEPAASPDMTPNV